MVEGASQAVKIVGIFQYLGESTVITASDTVALTLYWAGGKVHSGFGKLRVCVCGGG